MPSRLMMLTQADSVGWTPAGADTATASRVRSSEE